MKLFMRYAWNTPMKTLLDMKLDLRLARMTATMTMMLLLLRQAVAHASVATTNATCKHATNMWGDPNPNIFYVCSVADQMPLQLHCPQGRGFFNGLGHLGCLPYGQWPSCRPNATLASTQLLAGCNSNSNNGSEALTKDQPWATLDPNQFYMCPGVNATPLLLNCAAGKGFIQTAQTVGCADWSHWRRQMQCESFF